MTISGLRVRRAALILFGFGTLATGSALAQQANTLLGINCAAPPVWHCPDTECLGAVVTQAGTVVETKTLRPYFLDCPADYKPGDKVNVVLSLHGGGSYANWQRNYFPIMDVKDKYKLVIITPSTPTRAWAPADDPYLQNIVDRVIGEVGKQNVERFILAGHSWGGATSSRIICTDYWKDKVDVRISLSGGRVGPTTPANRGFGAGGVPVYQSGQPQPAAAPAQARPPAAAAALAGGADQMSCNYSFIFENGEHEATPGEASPLADKFSCGKRVELPEVIDRKQGYVWDPSRQDPGTDGWGHYPRSGRAKVYQYPNCKDGRVVADVVRLGKGHTEGLEPNITDKMIEMAVSARGGKIKNGSWTPPAPPPASPGLFGG